MEIVFATSNPHKVREVRSLLEPSGIAVRSLAEFSSIPPEPVEDADTFNGNARIKARAYAAALNVRCLAEDSGLSVDALGGAPGVHSARYAAADGDRAARDAANNQKLLEAMRDVPDDRRAARFVCSMVVADPDGTIIAEAEGEFPGVIARAAKGSGGFGYDPLLMLPELNRTSAELSADEKNQRSHRGQALRLLLSRLVVGE